MLVLPPLLTHRCCQGSAKQLKRQSQNRERQRELTVPAGLEGPRCSCGSCSAGQELAKYLQNLQQHLKKTPKLLKKIIYFTHSPKISKSNHGSHFCPFLSARFNRFSRKISWLILQIKCCSFSPKRKDKDEWKFKVAKLSYALEVASFSNMPRQRVIAPEVLRYLIWTVRVAVN